MGASEIAALLARFDGSFAAGSMPAKQKRSPTSPRVDEGMDIRLVTSDKAALFAAALLDLGHRSMCLGDVLRACGLNKRLEAQHETAYHRACLAEGTRMRIQGRGLRVQESDGCCPHADRS